MAKSLPFEIHEAIVATCGKAFWLRDPFQTFMLSCGVPKTMYARHSEGSKYKIARNVLADLTEMGEEGYLIQRRIVTEFCKMRALPDPNVPDPNSGLDALRNLKSLALTHQLGVEEEVKKGASRSDEFDKRQRAIQARLQRTVELQKIFSQWVVSTEDPHARGYGLEDLLRELFLLHEIDYRPSYKTLTEQIDGCFQFDSFHYIVEARWRKEPPSEADLAVLKTKVDKKLESTRGLFVSIQGYRQEVIQEFTRGISSKILLMDGHDLALILEGQVSLIDALDYKIQKATQEGIIYAQLVHRFS